MTQAELFRKIARAGMVPVAIEVEVSSNDHSRFAGDLGQFLKTARAIGATAVFVETIELRDFCFSYDPDSDEDDPEAEIDQENEIDLTTICPNLKKYKKRLGQALWFELHAKGGAGDLFLSVDQEWKQAFDEDIERAQGEAFLARAHRN